MSKEIIEEVYQMLKNREVNPDGDFDSQGRFYATNADLIDVRAPSKAWPYSQLVACRTKKYVKKVCEKWECKTVEELLQRI